MNEGKLIQIIGPVVDVEFAEGELPEIFTALFITRNLLESIITLPSMQKRGLLSGGRWVK